MLRSLLALALCCSVLAAQAQVYTWVDANGQKHYGNMPPTPEQPIEAVEIRATSPGSAPAAPVAAPEAEPQAASPNPESTEQSASQAPSSQKMCSDALRWTASDIPNLQEIGRERRRQGKISQSQYQKAMSALDQVKTTVTMPNCLASSGDDRRQFECLSQGLGIAVCSGALSEALNKL
ncbi:DUF4124 domain-containing protein [Aquipseudomonas ullengensis]|uniref:DUF4124 domain-containing protein n=1 Tax=Aquipseudomonas ullengensis TaxID=2759166 RepID=A0A7W4LLD1_9GAMM|nr:DUF4124 domain-containing protein [Pseudomonas ullengensis]MBB2495112.1 DUF4124 domain-containing protein [Pseudomonas ullengensis]